MPGYNDQGNPSILTSLYTEFTIVALVLDVHKHAKVQTANNTLTVIVT
jgi:hypothetical protein